MILFRLNQKQSSYHNWFLHNESYIHINTKYTHTHPPPPPTPHTLCYFSKLIQNNGILSFWDIVLLFAIELISKLTAIFRTYDNYDKMVLLIFFVFVLQCLQEGDTALNLIIKSAKLRDTGDMYKCAEMLVQHGALSTYKDLVRMNIQFST